MSPLLDLKFYARKMSRLDIFESLLLDYQIADSLSVSISNSFNQARSLKWFILSVILFKAFRGSQSEGQRMFNVKLSDTSGKSATLIALISAIFMYSDLLPHNPTLSKLKLLIVLAFLSGAKSLPMSSVDPSLDRQVVYDFVKRALMVTSVTSLAINAATFIPTNRFSSYIRSYISPTDGCIVCGSDRMIRPNKFPCHHQSCYVCATSCPSCPPVNPAP